jgi:hypothetical protein
MDSQIKHSLQNLNGYYRINLNDQICLLSLQLVEDGSRFISTLTMPLIDDFNKVTGDFNLHTFAYSHTVMKADGTRKLNPSTQFSVGLESEKIKLRYLNREELLYIESDVLHSNCTFTSVPVMFEKSYEFQKIDFKEYFKELSSATLAS